MSALRDIAVVGGSIAAVTAANALRASGFQGSITLYSAESHAPYTRPPLSKDILCGRNTPESARLHLAADIEVRCGVTATGLDVAARRLRLTTGERIGFDGLVIATGARARTLTADPAEWRLRSMDDAVALRDRLISSSRVVIIGGGPLGMEIASVCRELGREVTVLDLLPPMRRQVGGYLADLITEAAVDAGVRVVSTPDPVEIAGPGLVRAGSLRFEADTVITAIGEVPNTEWLRESGLTLAGGVLVDPWLRAAPGIVAAGDVAARRILGAATADGVRTPLWANAVDQATAAAAALLGKALAPYQPRPYFWTEQFGLSIKVCGDIPGDQPPTVLEGSRRARNLVLRWHTEGAVVAAATVNHRMPIARLRRLAAPANSEYFSLPAESR
ncbi:NAD(P)/FAD-dependent oxidoreductase [Nocardia sp. NPDC056000]|uniref:NAD(P)/FAD-dependent oxidoreductase n=1 Tax=Nocardia sp. NPDC056000 TaxID=3345674 RepID=UPI0035D9021C